MPWSVTTHSASTAAVNPFNSRASLSRCVFHSNVIDFAFPGLMSVSPGLQLDRWGSLPKECQSAAVNHAAKRDKGKRSLSRITSFRRNYKRFTRCPGSYESDGPTVPNRPGGMPNGSHGNAPRFGITQPVCHRMVEVADAHFRYSF